MMSNGRIVLAATYALVAVVAVTVPRVGRGQQPMTKEQRAEQFRQRSDAAEKAGLASAFKGIATTAGLESGLFAIRSTGVSTDPVVKAAHAFLATLSAPQRKASTFGVDDIEWRKWMNQDFYIRQGVSLLDLSES